MNKFWDICQPTLDGVGGWFLGGCDGPLCTLLAFVALNCLTGVMCAVADRELSGRAGFQAVCQKILIFGLVGIGHVLDTQVIGTDSFLRIAMILFYIYNEGTALIQNAEHLGLITPARLKTILKQLLTF